MLLTVFPDLGNLLQAGLWLARNVGSSPYITHYSTFHYLLHSFIPSEPKASKFRNKPSSFEVYTHQDSPSPRLP